MATIHRLPVKPRQTLAARIMDEDSVRMTIAAKSLRSAMREIDAAVFASMVKDVYDFCREHHD